MTIDILFFGSPQEVILATMRRLWELNYTDVQSKTEKLSM